MTKYILLKLCRRCVCIWKCNEILWECKSFATTFWLNHKSNFIDFHHSNDDNDTFFLKLARKMYRKHWVHFVVLSNGANDCVSSYRINYYVPSASNVLFVFVYNLNPLKCVSVGALARLVLCKTIR